MAAKARCPECGAMLADGAEWCPQCYTDLREPEPARLPDTDDTAGPEAAALRARHRSAGSDVADDPPPGWPCPTCGTVNDVTFGPDGAVHSVAARRPARNPEPSRN